MGRELAPRMRIREDEIIIKKEEFHRLKMVELTVGYYQKMADDLAKENFKLKSIINKNG